MQTDHILNINVNVQLVGNGDKPLNGQGSELEKKKRD